MTHPAKSERPQGLGRAGMSLLEVVLAATIMLLLLEVIVTLLAAGHSLYLASTATEDVFLLH